MQEAAMAERPKRGMTWLYPIFYPPFSPPSFPIKGKKFRTKDTYRWRERERERMNRVGLQLDWKSSVFISGDMRMSRF